MSEKRFYLDVSEAYSGILKIIDFGDGTENIYPTSSRPDMEAVVELLNELNNENEQLKKELSEYKDFVFSDDKILCYTCLFCTHRGIYEVDCDIKGHVDVHGVCHNYTKKELKE